MTGPQVTFLPDGRRLHLHHGPIDLIVDITGPGRDAAISKVCKRFDSILSELVDDLKELRQPVEACCGPLGPVADKMRQAARAHLPQFVTPMAAVAGAVADEMARVISDTCGIETAFINNGGDVALVLAKGQSLTAALGWGVRAQIHAEMDVRGVATSGWRGRSQSLGIADAVTVLARNAAAADVAATLIANHVTLPDHPAICRAPAQEVFPDSDLGARLVTTGVGVLTRDEVDQALDAGAGYAQQCVAEGLIAEAYLRLNGQTRMCGAAHALRLDQKDDLYA